MNPNITASFMAMVKQIQFLLMIAGAVMVHLGMDHGNTYKYVMEASGSIIIVATGAWGFWCSFQNFWKSIAIGAQAGINMTVAGKAVTEDGSVISKFSAEADATPPKLVTQKSGAEIVAQFAPATAPAKS